MSRGRWFAPLLGLCAALVLIFLALPVAAVFTHTAPSALLHSLGDPVARDALRLSLETSTIAVATIVLVGTPAAFLFATRTFPGRSLLLTVVELPLVLPPAVAGIALLAALGPNGILGGVLHDAHVQLVLQRAGVVVALTFVSAPFYIRQAQAAFGALPPTLLEASRTLGKNEAATFALTAVPVALSGLLTGLALAWGRALGEFGATLMFAGSFRGVTQTVPLAIYDRFASDFPGALALSAILVIVSACLLGGIKLLSREAAIGSAAG